jgi:hypothetical protein
MSNDDIIAKLLDKLQSENYEVFENLDNSETRGANAVSIGIGEVEQVNFALPDYKTKINIYISSHINEDKTGEIFKSILNEVKQKLDVYVLKEQPLSGLFEDVPVVGFWFDKETRMVVDDQYGACYLAHLEYTAITSF